MRLVQITADNIQPGDRVLHKGHVHQDGPAYIDPKKEASVSPQEAAKRAAQLSDTDITRLLEITQLEVVSVKKQNPRALIHGNAASYCVDTKDDLLITTQHPVLRGAIQVANKLAEITGRRATVPGVITQPASGYYKVHL